MDLAKIEDLARRQGRAFKVLIVDDEPRVRDIFKQFCEITGSVEVEMAENGAEALKMIQESDYDLVTMDLIMPEMSGVEAVTKIKELKPYLPVIVITGNATESLVRQAGVKGANKLMYKPVLMENFVDEVVMTFEKAVSSRC
ncbi:MAG: response regulator [Candidatus Zixiibacteriota bacterium]